VPRVVIVGYFGYGNLGDEAILSAMLADLREEIPDLTFTVVAGDPARIQADHGVETIPWFDVAALTPAIEASDLVIIGGGGLFHDYWGTDPTGILTSRHAGIAYLASSAMIAALLGKPLMLYGVGVGPLFSKEGREITRSIFEQAQAASVRDEPSRELLEALGIPREKVLLTADPGFSLRSKSPLDNRDLLAEVIGADIRRPLLGVALRNWNVGISQDIWVEQVALAMEAFLRDHDGQVLLLPFQDHGSGLTNDRVLAETLASRLRQPERVFRSPGGVRASQMLRLISQCDALIGMRMHSLVLAALGDVPFVGLAYDEKVLHVMDQLGRPEFALPLVEATAPRITALLNKASKPEEGKESPRLRLESLVTAARRNASIASEVIRRPSGTGLPPQPGITRIALDQLLRLGPLEQEVESGRQNVDLLQARLDEAREREAGIRLDLATALARIHRLGKEKDALEQKLNTADASLREEQKESERLRVRISHEERQRSEMEIALHESRQLVEKSEGEKDSIRKEAARQLDEARRMIAGLEGSLNSIYSSRGWRFLQSMWGLRKAIIPVGSVAEGMLRLGGAPGHAWPADVPLARRRPGPLQRLAASLEERLPPSWKEFLADFRFNYPRQGPIPVTVYARSDNILPGYTPRRTIPAAASGERQLSVSLISTTRNEAGRLGEWWESLLKQTRLPDELVIVDGGSTDGTLQELQRLAKESPFPVVVLEAPRTNIARGRNLAIQRAQHRHIACTDLGCRLDSRWLETLVAAFEVDPDLQVVGGFYQADAGPGTNDREAHWFVPKLEAVGPRDFLPSSRSLAMTKRAWAEVEGYPEWLTDAAEDTLFAMMLKEKCPRWGFAPEAMVYWTAPQSARRTLKTFWRYARGDGEVGLFADHYGIWADRSLRDLMSLLVAAVVIAGGLILTPWFAVSFPLAVVWILLRVPRIPGKGFGTRFRRWLMAAAIQWVRAAAFASGVRGRRRVEERRDTRYTRELAEMVARHPEAPACFVYPPTHDWGLMFQRPHQMARAFARRKVLYFYCTANERSDSVVGFAEVEPCLFLTHVPLETFKTLSHPTVYVGSPWHRSSLENFNYPTVIYDHYDDLAVSSARREDHDYLLRNSDLILVTSRKLRKVIEQQRPDSLWVPNGVDYALIQELRAKGPRSLSQNADDARPVVGYSGALAEWFDYGLLREVARLRQDLRFVLVGLSYDGSLEKSGILTLSNIQWLGLRPYQEALRLMLGFDVASIPFKVNDVTLATSPIKLFEYMAAGKPVVSTRLPECEGYEGVFLAQDAEEFSHAVDRALSARKDQRILEAMDRVARDNTWDARAAKVFRALENLPTKTALPSPGQIP
jgi:polysaccharide pyruvyl transferase CsaB